MLLHPVDSVRVIRDEYNGHVRVRLVHGLDQFLLKGDHLDGAAVDLFLRIDNRVAAQRDNDLFRLCGQLLRTSDAARYHFNADRNGFLLRARPGGHIVTALLGVALRFFSGQGIRLQLPVLQVYAAVAEAVHLYAAFLVIPIGGKFYAVRVPRIRRADRAFRTDRKAVKHEPGKRIVRSQADLPVRCDSQVLFVRRCVKEVAAAPPVGLFKQDGILRPIHKHQFGGFPLSHAVPGRCGAAAAQVFIAYFEPYNIQAAVVRHFTVHLLLKAGFERHLIDRLSAVPVHIPVIRRMADQRDVVILAERQEAVLVLQQYVGFLAHFKGDPLGLIRSHIRHIQFRIGVFRVERALAQEFRYRAGHGLVDLLLRDKAPLIGFPGGFPDLGGVVEHRVDACLHAFREGFRMGIKIMVEIHGLQEIAAVCHSVSDTPPVL